MFNVEWLLKHRGDKPFDARNVHNRRDKLMNIFEFISLSQSQSTSFMPEETERYYWKDAECPHEWRDWLSSADIFPSDLLPHSSNDLLRHLISSEPVESLMCYLGIGDTFTPAHKDLCASSGHNLMCYSEKDGSSFWFMTASDDASAAAEYFQKELKSELDWETYVATAQEFADAPFPVYITEQKLGDLVLVPPRSCHQVVNYGGLTIKTSWSRMTIDGLTTALYRELPIYRRVCRPEQYRVKSILYRTLLHDTARLAMLLDSDSSSAVPEPISPAPPGTIPQALVDYASSTEDDPTPTSPRSSSKTLQHNADIRDVAQRLKHLLALLDEVLRQEFTKDSSVVSQSKFWDITSGSRGPQRATLVLHPRSLKNLPCNFACDFCGADIFQSFFECRNCAAIAEGDIQQEPSLGDGVWFVPSCYVEGRSCLCEDMQPAQCRPFDSLLRDRNQAAEVLRRVFPDAEGEYMFLTINDLTSHDDVRIFEAACALRKIRQSPSRDRNKLERSCRAVAKSSHHVPFMSALQCSICHGARCFGHLLEGGMHSAEAILAYGPDWHRRHLACKSELAVALSIVNEAERNGGAPQLKHRLMAAAWKFRSCKPIHPRTKVGWYDAEYLEPGIVDRTHIQTSIRIKIPLRDSEAQKGAAKSISDAFSSPLTDCDDLPDVSTPLKSSFDVDAASDIASVDPSPPISRHKVQHRRTAKREIFDFVLVPPVPESLRGLKRAMTPEAAASPKKRTKIAMAYKKTSRCSSSCTASDDDIVGGNYGGELARALSNAHSEQPTFSRTSPNLNQTTIAGRALRRILSPESGESTQVPHDPVSNPISSTSTISTRDVLRYTPQKRRYTESSLNPPLRVPSKKMQLATATSSKRLAMSKKFESIPSAGRPPSSTLNRGVIRRRGGPPGIRHDRIADHRKRVAEIDRINREDRSPEVPNTHFSPQQATNITSNLLSARTVPPISSKRTECSIPKNGVAGPSRITKSRLLDPTRRDFITTGRDSRSRPVQRTCSDDIVEELQKRIRDLERKQREIPSLQASQFKHERELASLERRLRESEDRRHDEALRWRDESQKLSQALQDIRANHGVWDEQHLKGAIDNAITSVHGKQESGFKATPDDCFRDQRRYTDRQTPNRLPQVDSHQSPLMKPVTILAPFNTYQPSQPHDRSYSDRMSNGRGRPPPTHPPRKGTILREVLLLSLNIASADGFLSIESIESASSARYSRVEREDPWTKAGVARRS
ncbi:hypothetical protein A0H81_04353 [Grifola frondosa]|uniref:JmjC domain-containing protein n=1 Tax=Grifola frondosa TaxID=5627 RepID=A0A1C7MF08_GRIFR|nr:hypothetical protein A0H81_04353 [Grifola frondosa]